MALHKIVNCTRKHLSQPWFDFVRTGEKKYEGRLNVDFWASLQIGDKIIFYNEDDEFIVSVKSKKEHPCFLIAIESVGLKHVLPSEIGKPIKEAVNDVYYKYYTQIQEKKYGVVLIEFELE